MHTYFLLSAISKSLARRPGVDGISFAAMFDKTDCLDSDRNMEKDSITHSIIYYYLLIDLVQRVVKLATVTAVGISYSRIASEWVTSVKFDQGWRYSGYPF